MAHFIRMRGSNGNNNGQFGDPEDIAVDSSGNVYVTDTTNFCVYKNLIAIQVNLLQSGVHMALASDNLVSHQQVLSIDSSDNVYVTDYSNENVHKT